MNVCPQCAKVIPWNRQDDHSLHCPHCGNSLPSDGGLELINVARVANLAEAGYLCDELIGYGIDARIHQLEQFSAVDHCWETAYLIRVPSTDVAEAAAQIRQYLAEEAAEVPAHDIASDASSDTAVDVLSWRPVALVVLAGVASFMLGQRFTEQRFERRAAKASLAHAVWAIGRPFVVESEPGQPRYRLSLDQRRSWILDTDRDGDGIFERRQRYPESVIVW